MFKGGNMNLKVWGITIVTVQKYLEKVTKAIDSLIYKRALASGYVSSKNLTEQGAYNVTKNIIDLSERKVNLINLNTICFNALREIDRVSAKILILKFIDALPSSEIASILEISDRTYFRKLNLAYEDLGKWLLKNKYTDDYFKEKYINEGWIMDVFYKNIETKNKREELTEEQFMKNIIKNLNKSNKIKHCECQVF